MKNKTLTVPCIRKHRPKAKRKSIAKARHIIFTDLQGHGWTGDELAALGRATRR